MGIEILSRCPAFQLYDDFGETYGGHSLCQAIEAAINEIRSTENQTFVWGKWDYQGETRGRPNMSENAKKAQHLKVAAINELIEIHSKWGACTPYILESEILEGCGGQPDFGGYNKNLGSMLSDLYKDAFYLKSSNSWPDRPMCQVDVIDGEKRVPLSFIIPKAEWQMLLLSYGEAMEEKFGGHMSVILTGLAIGLGAVLIICTAGLALKIGALLYGLYRNDIEEEMRQMGDDIRTIRTKMRTVEAELTEKIQEEAQEEQMKGIGKALIPLVLLAGVVGLGS